MKNQNKHKIEQLRYNAMRLREEYQKEQDRLREFNNFFGIMGVNTGLQRINDVEECKKKIILYKKCLQLNQNLIKFLKAKNNHE